MPSRPAPLPGDLPNSGQEVAAFMAARRDKRANGDKKEFQEQTRDVYLAEVEARVAAAVTSDTPLLERLTQFWSNHFTVSAFRPIVRGFAGAFEREAIRPHVTGRFVDMLLAAEGHPAMLLYLDNALSIGPDSPAGLRQGKGLNENLGREILELHTLGVDGGYSQQDVEALARILTGWSVSRLNAPDPGNFKFYDRAHEPGPKTLLGRRYAEDGRNEGVTALRDRGRIRRRRITSPPSSRAISSPTIRPATRSSASPRCFGRAAAISRASARRWCARTRPGPSRSPRCARPTTW